MSRYKAGLIDSLALNQAISLREQMRAAIPTLRANIEITMNALAALVGVVPGSLEESLLARKPLPHAQNVSLAGIPAEAMRRRPDVRAAERRFAAQISARKSAEKDLLPKFSLLGSIGLEALEGNTLFSSSSVGFTFGPQITLPIFNGGAIRRNIEAQTEIEKQLLAAYEQTVLQAAAEVRGAVASCAQEALRNRLLRTGTEAVNNTLVSAWDRYKNGLTSFSDVMQAQGSLLQMEDQLAQSDALMTANLIKLFKALGGGWTPIANEAEAVSADVGAR
jgi:outer membrane protein TolC